MKGNNGSGNVVERDDWETPQWLFDILNKQYNFKIDCCATRFNSKCPRSFGDFEFYNGDIKGNCWMNPPFSNAYDMFYHFFLVVKNGVAIFRCDNMETKIWHEIILKKASWIFIPRGRISYEGKVGKGSRFPSALIGINVEPIKDIDGVTLIIKQTSHKQRSAK